MKPSTLVRYEALYQTARHFAADKILREHLGVSEDYILPLGVCHGIDYGQARRPCDILTIEPIYWGCNPDLAARARAYKPAVPIPHPLLLAASQQDKPPSEGTLIIGPPPSPENDRRLLERMTELGLREGTMLVKRKKGWERSADFWRENGFEATDLGPPGEVTYRDMARLFASYAHVVGCTVSSAVVFAAALGADVSMIRGYSCFAYEIGYFQHNFAEDLPHGRDFVRMLCGPDQSLKRRRCREVLGEGLDWTPSAIRAAIDEAIESLDAPFHFPTRYPAPVRYLIQEAAARLKRPGLVTTPLSERLRPPADGVVGIQEISEVDMWVEGRSDRTYSFYPVPFVAGVTIPGDAPDPW